MDVLVTFVNSLKAGLQITGIILVLMVVVELLVLKYQEKILGYLNRNKFFSYVISSFFGIIPGCIGTFTMDTLYMSGLLGFGGIVAVMVATSGDEMFVMLSMGSKGEIAWSTILLFTVTLFVLGVVAGVIADYLRRKMNIKFCKKCRIAHHKLKEFKLKHFITEHIYTHIVKKHIWQVFLWLFAAIFIIDLLKDLIQLDLVFAEANMLYILLIAALVGIIPISGPNVFLLVLFSKGLVPFSVVLTNSIIQDGHGLLPVMGFSIEDALKIKIFNLVFGLFIGGVLLSMGF